LGSTCIGARDKVSAFSTIKEWAKSALGYKLVAIMFEQAKSFVKQSIQVIREVFYGMTVYDWVHELEKARNERDRLFTMIVYGDLLGIPILPPYYTLRLLPYLVPDFKKWQRSMLRERDFTDLFDQEIG
jgi:hypothetical protein